MASIHKTIIDAVAAKLATLTLPGFTAANIFTAKLPTDRASVITAPPAIVVSIPGKVSGEAMTTAHNAWGYPCRVSFIWAANQVLDLDDDELDCVETARDAFHGKTISGASTVVLCKVEDIEHIVPSLFWSENVTVAEFVVRAVSYETRP